MSDEPLTARLQSSQDDSTVRKLYAETQKRKERNRQLVTELTNTKSERDNYKTKWEDAAKELETYRAEPSEIKAQYDALKGELRGIKHKEVFQRVAAEQKVRPDALDDLWRLTGYQPEQDDPDEARIAGLLAEAVKSRPYLVQEEAAPPAPSKLVPSPASDRGSDPRLKSGFTVKRSELNSIPTGPFAEQYQAAMRDGTLVILNDYN